MIRKYQPEIVICNAIDDRHITEKEVKLVSTLFLSGLVRIEPNWTWESQKVYIKVVSTTYNGKI
jgi:hypothetical protein